MALEFADDKASGLQRAIGKYDMRCVYEIVVV